MAPPVLTFLSLFMDSASWLKNVHGSSNIYRPRKRKHESRSGGDVGKHQMKHANSYEWRQSKG
eukprot:607155-Hanusia_phi.AAC.10